MDKSRPKAAAGPARNKSAVLVTTQVQVRQYKPGTFNVTGELLFWLWLT